MSPLALPSSAAIDGNYVEGTRIVVASMPRGEFRDRRGVAIVSSGLPVEATNWGLLRPPFEDVVETANAVRAFFGPALPFRLVLRGEHDEALHALEADGWRRRPLASRAMLLELPASTPPPPQDLQIRSVQTPAELALYRETAFAGFGFPVRAAGLFLHERLLELSHVRLYAGFLDGTVVATSMLVATGAIAGVYWVATPEAYRRRGYGEALTWAAVAGGRELGGRIAFLEASEAGFPVYARMGFAHAFDYEHLHPAE